MPAGTSRKDHLPASRRRDYRNNLLSKDIKRRKPAFQYDRADSSHGPHERQRFQQLRRGVSANNRPFRHTPQRVPGASDTLQKWLQSIAANPIWQTRSM